MNKRDSSRVHIAVRQNDSLAEFENFKRKFLFANKQITKQNCSLSMKIEELNAHISTLYVENLRLRASEIALQSQLKREKVRSHKIMADAEAAALNLLKHFGFIRESYNVPTERPHSPKDNADSSPPLERCQKPPPRSPSALRLAQLPTVPDIHEEPEPHENETSSEENEQAQRFASERRESLVSSRRRTSISRLPVPSRVSSPPPMSAMPSSPLEEGTTTSRKRKLTRRASGLMSSVEPGPRPVSPVLGSPMNQDMELSAEEEAAALQDVEDIAAGEDEQDQELPSKKPRKKSKTRDESDPEVVERRERRKTKDKERDAASAVRLKDVTNSPRRRRAIAASAVAPSADPTSETDHTRHGQVLPNAARPALAISPPLKLSSGEEIGYLPTPAPSSAGNTPVAQHFALPPSLSDAEVSLGNGRERRARKSVNYAEPKLNTKMRKPDSIPLGARASLPIIMPALTPEPNQNQNNQIRGPAGSSPEFEEPETQATTRTSLSSRPSSASSASSSSSSSSSTSSKLVTVRRSSSLAHHSSSSSSSSFKRKRSAQSFSEDGGAGIDDEDETDGGGEADSEFSDFRAWANINTRRKSVQNNNKMALDINIEEGYGRRHSMAV